MIFAAASVVLLCLLVYQFVLKPVARDIDSLRNRVPLKEEELAEVEENAELYAKLAGRIKELSSDLPEPEADFRPSSFIEKALEESGIGSWSFSSTTETREERMIQVSVDISIEETGWRELIDFFRQLDEAAPSLRLSNFDIRQRRVRRGDNQQLTANVSVTGLRRPE